MQRFSVLSLTIALTLPLSVSAKDAPLGLNAEVATGVGYDSNILRLHDNEDSDSIFLVKPNIRYHSSYGKHRFSGKY